MDTVQNLMNDIRLFQVGNTKAVNIANFNPIQKPTFIEYCNELYLVYDKIEYNPYKYGCMLIIPGTKLVKVVGDNKCFEILKEWLQICDSIDNANLIMNTMVSPSRSCRYYNFQLVSDLILREFPKLSEYYKTRNIVKIERM